MFWIITTIIINNKINITTHNIIVLLINFSSWLVAFVWQVFYCIDRNGLSGLEVIVYIMKLQSAVLVCILRLEAITCFSIYEHAHHKSSHGKSNPHRGIEKFFNSAKSIQKPPGNQQTTRYREIYTNWRLFLKINLCFTGFPWSTGYEKILKRARKLDEHPQEMEETGDRNMAPSGRGFTTDTTRRWKNQMLNTLDPAFSTQLVSYICKQNVSLLW